MKGRRTAIDRLRRRPDRREQFAAVDKVSLRVESGEAFGILGPNGAGKTTLLRILCTLLLPTSGSARVLGTDVCERPRDVRRKLGAMMSGERSLYWKLTARDNLEYFAALYQLPPRDIRARIVRVLDTVQLSDRADDYVERFSTGMRQRLALARALLPDPEILIVDEPTVGLDPQATAHLRGLIARLKEEGRTVILTTHDMEEADQVCGRVAIIDHGRILALGTPDELKGSLRTRQVVHLEAQVTNGDRRLVEQLQARAAIARVNQVDGSLRVTLHCDSARDLLPTTIEMAAATDAVIQQFQVEPVTLEEVFLSMTGRGLRD